MSSEFSALTLNGPPLNQGEFYVSPGGELESQLCWLSCRVF